jgi:hypothetical protein
MTAIRQEITVQANGLIEVRSSELHEGDLAEVTIWIKPKVQIQTDDDLPPQKDWRDFLGCLGPGDHGSSDNESIDRDLAASYLDNHEPEK